MCLSNIWKDVASRVDTQIKTILEDRIEEKSLREAAAYALRGGKRFRPLLMAASARALGIDVEAVLSAATAVEFAHAFSLVHDDLPGLDNDATRRGVPSLHKAHGEGMAVLVGDALLTLAFDTLLHWHCNSVPSAGLVVREFSKSVLRMIHGQVCDSCQPAATSESKLLETMSFKTGALIRFCLLLPTHLMAQDGPDKEQVHKHLESYAHHLGILYQISDDIEDGEGCVSVVGPDESQLLRDRHSQAASAALSRFLGSGISVSKEGAEVLKALIVVVQDCVVGPLG